MLVQRDLVLEDIRKGKLSVSHKRKIRLFSPKSKAYLQIMEKSVNAQGAEDSDFGKS